MIMSEKEEDRCFQLECIDVYRQLPALWKVKSDDYSDRKKKDAAYAVLVEKFKEKYPNYTRDDVIKKNSYRTNYHSFDHLASFLFGTSVSSSIAIATAILIAASKSLILSQRNQTPK